MIIYKYTLPEPLPFNACVVELELPRGAWVLDFQVQDSEIRLWAVVDPNADKEIRRYLVQGTGHPITQVEDLDDLVWEATVQRGSYVWHIFEICPLV